MELSAFISYRCSDGVNFPANLDNYLKSQHIDSYCDQNDPLNNGPIKQSLPHEVSRRDNFIILFTKKSINTLLDYRKGKAIKKEDYVDIELNAAINNRCNIIPVFIDDGGKTDEYKKLCQELFVGTFGMSDIYHFEFKEKGMTDGALFRRIKDCLSARAPMRRTDLSNIYWVGSRMSDVENSINFKGYIALFGEKSDATHYIMCSKNSLTRVDHNDASDLDQDKFIEESIDQVLKKGPDAKFMFYNPSSVYRLKLDKKYGKEHFVCLNDADLLNSVNNKRAFRDMMCDTVPMLPVIERTRVDCDYDDLLALMKSGAFEDRNDYCTEVPDIKYTDDVQFIVQAPISSGGAGTFILNKENSKYILSSLDSRAKYLVSIYYLNNIAVNMHVLIDANSVILLPGSIQLEREVTSENKLLYKGADFITYGRIDYYLRKQFQTQVEKIALELKKKGYRGVLGVDAIIHDGRVNVLEVNGRFQASTELINRALRQNGFKTLQELNLDAFTTEGICEVDKKHCASVTVNFSNFSFCYEGQIMHDKRFYERAAAFASLNSPTSVVAVQSDGYNPDFERYYNAQAYLYRVVFNKSISSVNEDGAVLINENIYTPDKWLTKKILAKEKLAIKIALLIQGINIDPGIKTTLREATNNAVDLQLGQGNDLFVVNSPTNIWYVEFSPFDLRHSSNDSSAYAIYYYDNLLLDNVGVFREDRNQNEELSDQTHKFSEIAYLSTDRLRVHLTNECTFKHDDQGCKFCNINVIENKKPITEVHIEEVVNKYVEDMNDGEQIKLRHFLIGGQSMKSGDEQLLKTAKVLSKYHMPIYVMTLPLSEPVVRQLVSLGVYEYAYNIEIFNKQCREKYMPGKGLIPVEKYFDALKMTRKVLNGVDAHSERKVVRSMVIVGLEPYDDMIAGIRKLIENNIEPMLSIFRPLPDTPLEHLNAPSIRSVYELFCTVSTMMSEYKMRGKHVTISMLGPKCICCQNNTVSLPWNCQNVVEVQKNWVVDSKKKYFESEEK